MGALSDKFDTPLGKRVPWYIFGTIIVLPTFLILFIHPFKQVVGDDGVPTNQYVYYLVLSGLFNIG